MKTYVIMISQKFPANHPRRGEETKFKQQIINAIFVNQGWNKIAAYPELGDKRHTIRANYDLWKKRIDEVQRGEACLSLRQWEGKPYRSKQIEFARLTNQDGVGIQQVNINLDGCARTINAQYECMNAESVLSKPKDGYGFVRTAIKESIVPEPMIGAFRGRNPENPSERGRSNGMYKQRLEINENGTSNTLTGVQKDNMVVEYGFRIRKLTERECFRLMDVPEEYIDRLMSDTGFIVYDGKKYVQVPRISRSRLYKMAGNSIVVACLYYIFDKLFIHTTPTELTLF